ncbi:autotransporter domain-containing protein [Devosia ginsengisoli]|uniref:Autotransporter domain-containing protein n=1 Tax=Devosia ginsengisoli TaxID=400770 RepID=A0A5B8LYA4_9HYPH|nr:autotransporter domain-containing protein [Devosia ginsengisoli]
MRFDCIRHAPLVRSLSKAASILLLGALLPVLAVSQAAAAATNGFLTTSFVTDDLCLAGPYKNSETADLSVTYGANTADDLQSVSLGVWNTLGGIGGIDAVFPPPGSTAATETVQRSFSTNHIVGTALYLYLYQSFTDAGDGRSYDTPPTDPTNVPSGFEGYYHQTLIDMALDPDCIPRPDVQLEYSGAVSSGPATALNGRDFGDVGPGDVPAVRNFTLRSIGISSVNVTELRINGSTDFAVSPSAPGPISTTSPFAIIFNPLTMGTKTAQLEIISDAVSGTISVPLTGNSLTDTTAPLPPVITTPVHGSTIPGLTPTIGGTAEAGSTVTVEIDGSPVATDIPVVGTDWTYTSSTLTAGPHGARARATDASGNSSALSPETEFTLTPFVSTVTLAASAPNSTFGTPVTFTATVGGGGSPTGSVHFFDGATALDTVVLSGNEAALSIATLGVGPHSIIAVYAGDSGNLPGTSAPVTHLVGQVATTVGIAASSPTSAPGQEVTFTATVSPATASGTVTFLIDSVPQTPVAVAGGIATLRTSLLSDGSHAIISRYDGDTNHAGSVTPPLAHTVLAQGSVIIRQQTEGGDAVFGFSSPTTELNLSIPTSGGRGESPAVALAAGTYTITADDMSGAGFGLTSLACSDADSIIDIANRSARIVLDAGEALICTFISVQSRDRTVQLIEDFLTTRAGLILSNQPDIQRRIDRLNGVVSSGGNPVSSLMGYLPGVASGSPLAVSTSLGAIDRLAGNEAPNALDIWLEGTFAIVDTGRPDGNFSAASFGADYLVTPDLLIGGFVQLDHLAQGTVPGAASISGTGWLAGPYVTALLNENLYLDLVAAAGTSQNRVSPLGTYEDGFDATRWLVSASLQGQWQWDNWTFSPRGRLSYFEETTQAYTDSLGVGIPSITAGLGQVAVGPAISYRYTTGGDVVIDTGLRFEGVAELTRTIAGFGFDNLHGRIEGTIDLSLPSGARFGLSTALDGIGGNTDNATSAKVRLSLPMQ